MAAIDVADEFARLKDRVHAYTIVAEHISGECGKEMYRNHCALTGMSYDLDDHIARFEAMLNEALGRSPNAAEVQP